MCVYEVGRVFANGPGDLGSIPGRVIRKILKMILDASLLNTQQYKVRIEGKVEQSKERCSAPLHLGVIAIEKGAFWSPSTRTTYVCTMYIYKYVCVYIYIYIHIKNKVGDLSRG